ncbi:hypothetical protein GOP56_00720 [Brevibacillus sp. 7WMA2]|uniref:Preprotein translocase subunit Tim44 n=2 Tax=Brevibacillus laterosporus TaxID=1465 RepID=A0A075R8K4_BRELA|nr:MULTISPECIES: hypothetical protein [Brevibacillus]AIG25885.1 hypothetical protein BRLA_c015590 [Brevibacillus laterosporus LMG 15441]AUM64496.1 hypothetical protein C0R09_08100 [Brevibacillus laterosporus]AYK07409.1 hypothetical protein D8Z77_14090 [Brevibacillus laterosporus]ERM18526.1 hypothetical protein P615_15905 [Brevibacillus laterosporus PE36]MBA4533478.1 hypothetical protein [Brevibacillus halotolerans]
MKRNKLLMVFMALALMFTTVGINAHEVDAKRGGGYKSGSKSFQPTQSTTTPKSNAKQDQNVNSKTNTTAPAANTASKSGGFMKGLLFGGLAGMLFGGLLGHLGGFGAFAAALLNILMLVGIVLLVVRLFQMVRNNKNNNKYKEQENRWKQ